VLILELPRAEIAGRRMKPACVVDLLYEVAQVFSNIAERFECHRLNRFNLQRLHEAFSLGVVVGIPLRSILPIRSPSANASR